MANEQLTVSQERQLAVNQWLFMSDEEFEAMCVELELPEHAVKSMQEKRAAWAARTGR